MTSTVSPQDAAAAAKKILGFYDTIPASDPKAFAAGLVATLSIFPQRVVDRASDPVRGIPSVVRYLNLADVRKHLDDWHAEEITSALTTKFHAKADTPQLAAWDKYFKKQLRDRAGGWLCDSEWPPGYQPQQLQAAE